MRGSIPVIVIAVVLMTLPCLWVVYWFMFRMNNRAGMDLGLTGSGFLGAMSDAERHARAERGMAKQRRCESALRRRWPIPVLSLVIGVVLLILAA